MAISATSTLTARIGALTTSIQAVKSFSPASLQLFQNKGWSDIELPLLLKEGPALFAKETQAIDRLDNILKKLEEQHPYRDTLLALVKTALTASLLVGSYLMRGTPWGMTLLGSCLLTSLLVCSSSAEVLEHPDSDRYFYQSKDPWDHVAFVMAAIIGGGFWLPLIEAFTSRKTAVEELQKTAVRECEVALECATDETKRFVQRSVFATLKTNRLKPIPPSDEDDNSPEKTALDELNAIEEYYLKAKPNKDM